MSVASPHDGAVFYSDDEGKNRIAAEAYAKRCSQAGKKTTTLEATPCGKWLESENLYATRLSLFADDIWALASVKYAGEASGSCRCFIANAPAERVFRKHELAALLANDKVSDLNNIPRQALKAIHERSPDAAFSAVEQADRALRAAAPTSAAGTAAGASNAASASSRSGSSSSAGGGGGLPAARISDFHICPMVTGVVPHVGGPIALGCPTVLIGGLPAARVGDMVVCVGPPDVIAKGSSKVFIGGMPAARLSDSTAHGGKMSSELSRCCSRSAGVLHQLSGPGSLTT